VVELNAPISHYSRQVVNNGIIDSIEYSHQHNKSIPIKIKPILPRDEAISYTYSNFYTNLACYGGVVGHIVTNAGNYNCQFRNRLPHHVTI
jgi:hypothetical protein